MPESSSIAPISEISPIASTSKGIDGAIALWVHGKSPHTQRYYQKEVRSFLVWVDKSPEFITLADVQAWATVLANSKLAIASQARAISAIKSFFTFIHQQLGIVRVNPAGAVSTPKFKNGLAERILPETIVQLMISLETNVRDKALLKLLYVGGLRVSEVSSLTWRSLQAREDGGQVLVYGKGSKTRVVKLPVSLWKQLQLLRNDDGLDEPIFISRKEKGHLSPVQIGRIVKKAALRVPGIEKEVAERISPHWLRHAHASHAIERGAPIHLVQATLGHESVATTGQYLHARPNDSSARYLSID